MAKKKQEVEQEENLAISEEELDKEETEQESATDQEAELEVVEEQIDFEHLLLTLKLLNEQQRQVLLLRFIEGFSIAETAQILQKSEGAIKALQHRSLENLRRYLQE